MFNPVSNSVKVPKTSAQVEAEADEYRRRQALEHAVDLAKAGASRYGAAGYTSHTLLKYATDLAAFMKNGTVPTDPNTSTVEKKPRETDPAGAPGPETRDYLKPEKDYPREQLAVPGEDIDVEAVKANMVGRTPRKRSK